MVLLFTCTNHNDLSANGTETTQRVAAAYAQMIVLKAKHHVQPMIIELTEKFPTLKLDRINEIGVIQIEHHEKEVIDNASKYIHARYGKYIVQEAEVVNPLELDTALTAHYSTDASAPSKQSSLYFQHDPKAHFYGQWGVHDVTEGKKSYAIAKGNHDVTIAILDSGIDLNHPDLVDNIIAPGRSFVPGEATTMDVNGHGTKVAGIIAANGNISGVAPQVGIVPYKVFSREGGRAFWMIKAMVTATDDGHQILNISSGIYQTYTDKVGGTVVEAFRRAIDYANRKGSIIVNSAGNEGRNINQLIPTGEDGTKVIRLPSIIPKVVTVGASTLERMPAPYSNYGKKIDFYAPGGSYGPMAHQDEFDFRFPLLTTFPTYLEQSAIAQTIGLPKGYDLDIGASLATSAVSATYALVMQKLNEYKLKKTPAEITDIVKDTAVPLHANDSTARWARMVNAYQALQYVENEMNKSE
ncbi:subtilisin-like serine proteases [Paenibacillus popilliae ATCC 14706]|uniref:Subtilisin-like serine proteases n=2 Tax=Paenibacillus popilliae TaxID=78057 RepID=M9M8W7_PAEPP|nr:subtilisin-like serine proteases [Paenibacillus popilliae ATCC 14706]